MRHFRATIRGVHDYDWLVIGSGFGGSVSALRLAEQGQPGRRCVEAGRRFADDELPKSTWDLRQYFFSPKLGCKGILRLTVFKDVFIGSGAGVGGGSLGYANTLYRAPRRFYDDAQWAGLSDDWGAELAPHYDKAERMLGVTDVTADDPADQLLREFGRELGVDETYAKTRVGVYLGRRRSATRTSAARGPSGHRARPAGAAWSAARSAPRTRWSRTTCGSPSSGARRSCPSARWSTSSRSATAPAPTATRSPRSAPGAWWRKDRRDAHRGRRRRRGRRARHQPAAAALQGAAGRCSA